MMPTLKLPDFAEKDLAQMTSRLSPQRIALKELVSEQQQYHRKAVIVEGRVTGIVSIDETDKETVASWGWNFIPTTVETSASATYFYIEDEMSNKILVRYLADLDVFGDDNVVVTGYFNAAAIEIEKRGLFRTQREQVSNELGEPFVTALSVENRTKGKIEYIRETEK